MKTNTLRLTRVAAVAALYTALTYLLAPISYGPLQFRVAECLVILAVFGWKYVFALTIGCFFANIPHGPIDMALGTFATFAAGVMSLGLRKIYFAVFPPIVVNALIVPVIFLTIPDITTPYWLNVLTVGAGQAAVILTMGVALYFAIKKNRALRLLIVEEKKPSMVNNP